MRVLGEEYQYQNGEGPIAGKTALLQDQGECLFISFVGGMNVVFSLGLGPVGLRYRDQAAFHKRIINFRLKNQDG